MQLSIVVFPVCHSEGMTLLLTLKSFRTLRFDFTHCQSAAWIDGRLVSLQRRWTLLSLVSCVCRSDQDANDDGVSGQPVAPLCLFPQVSLFAGLAAQSLIPLPADAQIQGGL